MNLTGIRRGLFAVALALFGSCATPPDVSPFAEATATLQLAVTSTARFAHQGIAEIDAELAARFDAEWEHRLKAMEAMNDYAGSLVAIVEAGDQGASAARQVLASAGQLFNTIGAAYPLASEVGRKLSSGAVAAFELYTKDRAAKTVARALADADPAVQEVADVLADDFATMGSILEELRTGERTDFIGKEKGAKPLIGQVQGLEDELEGLNERLSTAFDATLVEQAAQLAELIERERDMPDYAGYVAGLQALEERYDAFDSATRSAADLVRVWGRSHRDLIQAAELGRTQSFETLVALSQELLEIYQEVRNTK